MSRKEAEGGVKNEGIEEERTERDEQCRREEGCLFSEATKRHLIFLPRPLDQGDSQIACVCLYVREKESIGIIVTSTLFYLF